MARKNIPIAPVKKKSSPRKVLPQAAKPHPAAHSRLVHGFLVRLPAGLAVPARGASPALTGIAGTKARAKRPPDARHEGPADDATFH